MKALRLAALGLISLLGFAPACTSEVESEELDAASIEPSQEPLCENRAGVNAVMTSLAVAAGQEMRRWLPARDFRWNSSTGMLELSSYAYPRCPNRQCVYTQSVLDMQKNSAHGQVVFAGNIRLDVYALRSALKAAWSRQMACNAEGRCPVEYHDLRYTHNERGSCDLKYFFTPYKMGTTTPLSNPYELSNQLLWVGYPENKMLNFYIRNGQVSIDPTQGLNEGSVTTSGSCSALCTRISTNDLSGRCCSCNGRYGRYARSAFSPRVYLCK